MVRLENKVAVITGVGSGMGRAALLLFATEGARVVGSDVNDEAGAETVRMARDQGGEASYIHCDVSKSDQVREMVDFAVRHYEQIDILYNNAGVPGPPGGCPDVSEEDWDRTHAVNLKGVYLCCKYAIPELIKQPTSSIISTASLAGTRGGGPEGFPSLDTYAATKGGIIGMSRWIAATYGRYGLRCNVICPGWIATAMLDPITSSRELTKIFVERTPLKRLGQPEDVAKVALFLASDDSSFLTGLTIPVDGGAEMSTF